MDVFRLFSGFARRETQGLSQDFQTLWKAFLLNGRSARVLRAVLTRVLRGLQNMRGEGRNSDAESAYQTADSGQTREDASRALGNEAVLLQVQRYLKAAGTRRTLDILNFLNAHQHFRELRHQDLDVMVEEWVSLGILATQVQPGSDWSLYRLHASLGDREAALRPFQRTGPCQDLLTHHPKPLAGQVDLSLPPQRFESLVQALQSFLTDELALLDAQRQNADKDVPHLPIQATLSFEPLHLHGDGLMALLQLFRAPNPKPEWMG